MLVPTPAIRNLIRDDKVHQIYSTMQTGQEKFGMQTMNQSLATLYQKRLIHSRRRWRLVAEGRAGTDDQPRRGRRPGAGMSRAGATFRERDEIDTKLGADLYADICLFGTDRGGTDGHGERVADTMDAAVAALRREQIMVTRIDPTKAAKARPSPRPGEEGASPSRRRTSPSSSGSSPS
jgi:hypothetical protein